MKISPLLIVIGIALIGVYCSAEEEELIREKRGRWSAHLPPSSRSGKKPASSPSRRPTPGYRKPTTSRHLKPNSVTQSPKQPDRWQPPRRLSVNEALERKSSLPPTTKPKSPRPPIRAQKPPVRRVTTKPVYRWTSSPKKESGQWQRPTTKVPRITTQKPSRPGGWHLPVPVPKDYGTSAIPGKPGKDYPTLYTVPNTGFSCANKAAGYYANVKARCQAFHVCMHTMSMKSFLCPNGTVFNQRVFTCDW